MKKQLLLLLALGPASLAAFADEADDRAAVIGVVTAFFEAMREADVEASRDVMTPDGVLYGYIEGADGLRINRHSHDGYLESLGNREDELIERFWDPQVLLHDRMAVVWTPYDLYINGSFSHCGIDSFNLLKTEEGWKIAGIVFSMEPDDCEESPLGALKDES